MDQLSLTRPSYLDIQMGSDQLIKFDDQIDKLMNSYVLSKFEMWHKG